MNDYKELIDELRCYAYAADDLIYGICVNSPKVMFQAADAIEQLVKAYEELDESNDAAWSEYRKVKKERDAAVMDLRLVANNCFEDYVFSACICCKKNDTCNGQPATGCEFEWRGVQEANNG